MLQADGRLIVAGAVGEQPAAALARLNADGSLDATYNPAFLGEHYTIGNTGYSTSINDIDLTPDGKLMVASSTPNSVGGQNRPIFRLLPSGQLDTDFVLDASVGPRNCTHLLAQPGGQIVALFDALVNYPDQSSPNYPELVAYPYSQQLAQFQASGGLDPTFQPGSGPDYTLAALRGASGGRFLTWGGLYGYLANFNGQRRTVALVQATGAPDASFAPLLQKPGIVRKVLPLATGQVLLSGDFTTVDDQLTDNLARLLPDGHPDPTFAWRQPASATWQTEAVAVQADGRVLLAGYNLTGGGAVVFQPLFTRLTTTGVRDPLFNPHLTYRAVPGTGIRLLGEQPGGQVVVGGQLADAAGRANLTRLSTLGEVDATFSPPAAEPVVQGGQVLADGTILALLPMADQPAYHRYSQLVQRLLSTGQPDPTFAFTLLPSAYYSGLDAIYPLAAGGYATSGAYTTGPHDHTAPAMGRLTPTGAPTPGFSSPFLATGFGSSGAPYSGIFKVADQPDGRLLVAGRLYSGFDTEVKTLARLLPNGQVDPSFATTFIPTSYSRTDTTYYAKSAFDLLVRPGGRALVGGDFLLAGGRAVTGLVQLLLPEAALATNPAHRSRAGIQAWPVPAHDALHLLLDAAAHPRQVVLLNTLGQPVRAQAVLQANLALDTSDLTPGLYLLRVEYADGLATQPVVLE